MPIKYNQSCSKCSNNHFIADSTNKIGETVLSEFSVGSGYSKTEYSFHQCSNCGTLWQKCVDSDAGGNSKSIKKLNTF